MALKFKKNDEILIITGSNKGKTGNIISIKNDRVVVEGINFATIHKKATSSKSGEIVKIEKSIHISNISHIEDTKPVKIAFKIESGGNKKFAKKIRVSKKTRKRID